jgi:hypothetical protein
MSQILTVIALSKSEKSVLVSVSTPIEGTPFVASSGSGNLMLDPAQPLPAVGDSFPVPAGQRVVAEERVSEDGKSFTWYELV